MNGLPHLCTIFYREMVSKIKNSAIRTNIQKKKRYTHLKNNILRWEFKITNDKNIYKKIYNLRYARTIEMGNIPTQNIAI